MVRTKVTRVVGNPGNILGFSLAGNPGRKKGRAKVAQTTAKKSHKPAGYGKSTSKKNPGGVKKHHGGHTHRKVVKRNTGGMGGSVGSTVTNALFVIAGALVSKLGAQAALGDNNKSVLGYFANAVAGGILWFATANVMKNKAASDGVIAGTLVQILLRMINDYTPFGSYIAQLGMGDYQIQSWVTPQVLVDPVNSAAVNIPSGWGAPAAMLPPPSAVAAAGAGAGMGSLYGTSSGGGGLY